MSDPTNRPVEFDGQAPVDSKLFSNHLVFVLDASTSMQPQRQAVVDFFNAQLAKARQVSGDMRTVVSLIEFADTVREPLYWAVPIESIEDLGLDQYRPVGNTALYDGIGVALDRLEAMAADMDDENMSFLVVTITDGENNRTVQYTASQIGDRIRKLKSSDRWTFAYMSAGQDLAKVQADLNLSPQNVAAFVATDVGYRSMTATSSLSTERFLRGRSKGLRSTDNFYK